jgi:hypothetical protein
MRKFASLLVASSLFVALGVGSTGCIVRTRDHQHYNNNRRSPPPPPPRRDHDHRGGGNDRCRWERC